MKNTLFVFVTIFMVFFSSCDNNDSFFNKESQETHTLITEQFAEVPDIKDDDNQGMILLVYQHPTNYDSDWDMYLQYKTNSQWRYCNSSGNYPNSVYSGYGRPYMVYIDGKYLPNGYPYIRICIKDKRDGKISGWSNEYRLKHENTASLNYPDPEFDSIGDCTITVEGYLRPSVSGVTSAEVTLSISGYFISHNVTKTYHTSPGFFSTVIGVRYDQTYNLNYTIKYYNNRHEVLSSNGGSNSVHTLSNNNYVNIALSN